MGTSRPFFSPSHSTITENRQFTYPRYNQQMLTAVWFILGLLLGIGINGLADFLPHYRLQPALIRPFFSYFHPPRSSRDWLTLAATAVFLALLTTNTQHWLTLPFNTLYIAILILIIVIDLEHKLIFNQVTYPGTAVVLLGSFLVDDNSIGLALAGTAVGGFIFYVIYWVGSRLFGDGALGFGDVKLAMLLGAMLGFHRIFFGLLLGVLLGGLISLLLLLTRRVSRHDALPYGQYLALGGIVMLIWGQEIIAWYLA